MINELRVDVSDRGLCRSFEFQEFIQLFQVVYVIPWNVLRRTQPYLFSFCLFILVVDHVLLQNHENRNIIHEAHIQKSGVHKIMMRVTHSFDYQVSQSQVDEYTVSFFDLYKDLRSDAAYRTESLYCSCFMLSKVFFIICFESSYYQFPFFFFTEFLLLNQSSFFDYNYVLSF